MSLYDTVSAKMTEALRAGDKDSLLVFRGLKSAIDTANKNGQEINDELVEKTVKSEVKKRKEAIEMYTQAGATDKAEQEQKEMTILEPLLPEQMPIEDAVKIVDQVISETGAKSQQEVGKVMGIVSQKLAGKADMAAVSQLVRNKLSS